MDLWEEACAVRETCVKLGCKLWVDDPTYCDGHFPQSLCNYGLSLGHLGRYEEGSAVIEESISIH